MHHVAVHVAIKSRCPVRFPPEARQGIGSSQGKGSIHQLGSMLVRSWGDDQKCLGHSSVGPSKSGRSWSCSLSLSGAPRHGGRKSAGCEASSGRGARRTPNARGPVARNLRATQVLVFGSIYQGAFFCVPFFFEPRPCAVLEPLVCLGLVWSSTSE